MPNEKTLMHLLILPCSVIAFCEYNMVDQINENCKHK